MAPLSRAIPFLRSGAVVPVVRIAGVIGQVRLQRGVTLEALAQPLERAFAMRSAPAVALVVNSPGGSPVQSHLIFRQVRALAAEHKKPVLAFVEDVAASGGYMVALAGDEIIVDPNSIVGSIGVVSAGFGLEGLIEKLGVQRRLYASGEHKAMLDPFLPENPGDIERLRAIQREVHDNFIAMVRERRQRLAGDSDLFSGAFWTGARGVELGLADRTGELRSVLRERFGEDVRIKAIAAGRGLLRRFGLSTGFAGDAADAALASLHESALWHRYGL